MSPPWSNVSSILPDGVDSSASAFRRFSIASNFQDSKVGSEVIASSNNLRKICLNENIHRPIATSSVMNYPVDVDQDSLKMPPPFTDFHHPSLKKIPKVIIQHTLDHIQNYKSDLKVSSKASETKFVNNYFNTNSNSENSQEHIFYNWRVMLHEDKQLIIKGMINNLEWYIDILYVLKKSKNQYST